MIAAYVRFVGALPKRNLLYWRGPVLDVFDGRTWSARPERLGRPAQAGGALEERKLPMKFGWVACAPNCGGWVSAIGIVTADTPKDFEDFAHGRDLSGATIVLDSSGGSVNDSIALGRRFRELGMRTTVGVSVLARRQGVATAALGQLSRWALAELGMLRLELRISVGNEASRTVARRCGYVLEGVLRSLHLRADERVDTELWSRLPLDP